MAAPLDLPLPPDVACKVRVHTIVLDQQVLPPDEYSINDFLGAGFKLPKLSEGFRGFRWIHVPVNNLAWVEECFQKCGRKPDKETWTLKVRPALLRNTGVPLHARHMEPSCDETHPPECQVALFLPYLNWDTYGNYKSLRAVYERWGKDGGLASVPTPTSARGRLEHALFPYLTLNNSLHPRRTLDQFYYSSLTDTAARDADQTVSKWTPRTPNPGADGRHAAENGSLLVMVDQLWCWVVDNRTVLSFFPSDECQYTTRGFRDLYHSIKDKANKCADVWDFYALVAKKTTNYFFNETDRAFEDLIELYRWVINKKAADQTTCFEEFHLHYSNGNPGSIVLDDRRELKLVLEVADIIDELNMIQYLLRQQRDVLQSLIRLLREHKPSAPQPDRETSVTFSDVNMRGNASVLINFHQQPGSSYEIENTKALAKGIDGIARDHVVAADEKLLSLRAEIDVIIGDAGNLLTLLDLKSKTASLLEARSSAKQGRAVMLFTIVTIIFLPLSFFTSYFGQNVSEITGDPKNPSSWHLWRIATPITIFVIAIAFVIAYYIGKPDSKVWRHGRRTGDVERQ